MRINGGSPNIINGVSRQPPEVRLTSQLEESLNQFPTITRGLVPRNPALLNGTIAGALPPDAKTHIIERDASERYVVTVHQGGVQVHDLEGNAKTVNTPDGIGYLAGAREGDIEALTVADHTFILNKRKKVQISPTKTAALARDALIHVVQGDYHTAYSIEIDGVVKAKVTTSGGPNSDNETTRRTERGARPAAIAHLLAFGTLPEGLDAYPNTTSVNLAATLGDTDWTIQVIDSVIYLKNTAGADFTVTAKAGSERMMRAHKGSTPEFSDLPRKSVSGFRIAVSGSKDTGYDDYWVYYDWPPGSSEGSWKETVAPDVEYQIDADTMPHILVREADGTFTFQKAVWAGRGVGDIETNPWPSFVGNTISGMSFGKNRIGFFSGESIANSRLGKFFDFFVESIITPLDTDPVDVTISYPEISNISHAVPFSGEIILFTSSVPFRLAGGQDATTQKNVHLEHLLSNKVSSTARPVAAGKRLYFVNDAVSGTFIHEFLYDREVGVKDAPCISEHVHGYVPHGVTLMEADDDLRMLVLHTPNDPQTLYVYKWLWVGQDKAQSAWQKWSLPDPIVALRFIEEELVLVTSRGTAREVLKVNCHEAWKQGGPTPVYLDRQVELTGTYDAGTETTTFTLPYIATGVSAVSRDPEAYGVVPTILSTSANTAALSGDWSGKPIAFGFEFESYGILSPLLHRSQSNQGAYGNALPGVETTVTNLRFGTGECAYLGVELDRDYRKPVNYSFSAALVGTKSGTSGSLVLGPIKKNVSILSKSEDFRLKFGNIGPFPYSVLSFAWTGTATPISY